MYFFHTSQQKHSQRYAKVQEEESFKASKKTEACVNGPLCLSDQFSVSVWATVCYSLPGQGEYEELFLLGQLPSVSKQHDLVATHYINFPDMC